MGRPEAPSGVRGRSGRPRNRKEPQGMGLLSAPSGRPRPWSLMAFFWTVSRALLAPPIRLAWRLRIRGKQHIPKQGAAVIASNHLSFLDHFILPLATRRPIYFISKAQHFDAKFKGWFFRNLGVIPLQRGEGDQAAFHKSIEILESGELFGIYPEGTRSLDGKLHKGRTGMARIALIARVPIVPAAMIGTFEAMPKSRRVPKLSKCSVVLGPPIDTSPWYGKEDDRAALRELTNHVMQKIAEVSGQEYVDEYQFNPEYKAKEEAESNANASAPTAEAKR